MWSAFVMENYAHVKGWERVQPQDTCRTSRWRAKCFHQQIKIALGCASVDGQCGSESLSTHSSIMCFEVCVNAGVFSGMVDASF